MVDVPNNSGMADAIRASAERLGIDPLDLATAVSYESAGTFDPKIKGPTTRWGQHIGLIQAGEPQRAKYGINPNAPLADQFAGIERYLTDAGVKPGHGLIDIYSAINSGRVGRPNASDAAAGGAPGTVADKVASMAPHRVRASLLLDGKLPEGVSRSAPAAQAAPIAQGGAPMGLAPAGAPASDDGLAVLVQAAQQIAASAHEGGVPEMPDLLPPLQVGPLKMGFGRMRRG